MKGKILAGSAIFIVWCAPEIAIAQNYSSDGAEQASAAAADAGDIVVTAQRRAQSLMTVPIAVSAMTADDLSRQGITQTSNLSGSVPSLQVTSAFGDAQPNFTLRGIGVGNEYGSNQASPVGVYTDDNYLGARTMHGMQLYDLERVEVLRGPQGTLYGRNTTGGAINFISVKPNLQPGTRGYVEAGYGRFNEVRAQGAVEGTLIEDKLGFRASANYTQSSGYMHNIQPGQPDTNALDSLSGRLIVRAKPTERLDIVLKVTGGRGKPVQAGAHHIGNTPDGTNPFTGYNRKQDNLGFWDVRHPTVGYNDVKAVGGQMVVSYELTDDLTISTLTAYDWADQVLTQEATAATTPHFLDTSYGDTYNQFNQEVRLIYSKGGLNVQAGGYYGWDKVDNHDEYGLVGTTFIKQHFIQTRKSKAVFAQVDYDLTSRLGITGGIRYTEDKGRFGDAFGMISPDANYDPANSLITLGQYVPGKGIIPYPTKRAKADAVTGKAGLKYQFDSGQMIYANYSRGYRAGAFSSQIYLSGGVDYVPPEKIDAYEIGAKGKFLNGLLSISAAAFYTKYKNQQLNEIIGVSGYVRSAPGSTVKGVELEATVRPSPALSANIGFSYLDARYDKLTLSGVVLDDNYLPFAPEATVNFSADWEFAQLGSGRLVFSPHAVYTSRSWFSPFNDKNGNFRLTQGPNAKLDLRLAWEGENVAVRLWMNNVFNRKTYQYGINLRDGFGYDYLLPAAPRTFGATLRYTY